MNGKFDYDFISSKWRRDKIIKVQRDESKSFCAHVFDLLFANYVFLKNIKERH